MFCRRCTLAACSTCCCRFRSVAPPSISSPSIKSLRRSQRPTRVREGYTTRRDSVPDRRESGPLYNIPLLTLYGVGFSGVALGIAGSCLAAFMQLAQTKSSGGGLGSTAVLRDNAVIQSRVAQACGQLGSARAFLVQM